AITAARPGDRSSACAPAWYGSRRHPPPTARTAAYAATARTSVRARWLPFLPVPTNSAAGVLRRTVRLLRSGPAFVLQTPRCRVHKCNLLERGMIVATYNHHVRLLCSSPLVVCASKVYPGLGADIVMESLHSLTLSVTGVVSVIAC